MSQPDPPDVEVWLLKRLQDHGVDVYAGGPFETLEQRLAWTIIQNRYGPVVAGRHGGKPETYEQLFQRMYGVTPQVAVDAGKGKESHSAHIARARSAP